MKENKEGMQTKNSVDGSGSGGVTGYAPHNEVMNGAHCNNYGHIYLRLMENGVDGDGQRWVDHGISLEEAICIRRQLDLAIIYAADIKTGRCYGAYPNGSKSNSGIRGG